MSNIGIVIAAIIGSAALFLSGIFDASVDDWQPIGVEGEHAWILHSSTGMVCRPSTKARNMECWVNQFD